jgi:hypothetical protein
MKSNGLCLDFALFHINLVATENDRDVFADSDEITCRRQYVP